MTKKVIAVLLYSYISHILPFLKLIQNLSAHKNTVYCFCEDRRYQKLLELYDGRFVYIEAPEKKRQKMDEQSMHSSPLRQLYSYFEKCLDMKKIYVKEVMSRNPCIILSDNMCLQGEFLSQQFTIPNVCFHIDFMFTQDMRKHLIYQSAKQKNAPAKAVKRLLGAFYPKNQGYDILNVFYSKMLNIAFLPKKFQPYHELLNDDRYLFVGYNENVFEPLKSYKEKKSGLLIDLGDLPEKLLVNLYKKCIEYVYRHDLQACINTSSLSVYKQIVNDIDGSLRLTLTNDYRPNIISQYEFYITSGGISYVREAILYETIPIIFPQHFDHQMTSYQMTRFNAGVSVHSLQECFEIYQEMLNNKKMKQNLFQNLLYLKTLFCSIQTQSTILHRMNTLIS